MRLVIELLSILVPVVLFGMGQMMVVMIIVVNVVSITMHVVHILVVVVELVLLLVLISKSSLDCVFMVIHRGVLWIIEHIISLTDIPEDVVLIGVHWNLIFPVVVRKRNVVCLLTSNLLLWLGFGAHRF